MSLLCTKASLLTQLRSTFLVDATDELLDDGTRNGFDFAESSYQMTATASAEQDTPTVSRSPASTSSILSRTVSTSSPVSPLTSKARLVPGNLANPNSSHSEGEGTETDFGSSEIDASTPREGVDETLIASVPFGMAVEDDSDLEEDIVLAAQELKLRVDSEVSKQSRSAIGPSGRRLSQKRPGLGMRTESSSSHLSLFRGLPDKPSSSPSLENLANMQPSPRPNPEYQKVNLAKGPGLSLLSQQLEKREMGLDHPLDHYRAAAATEGLNLTFKIQNKENVLLKASVIRECPVHLALGYALYLYKEGDYNPPLSDLELDANRWNVRLMEEDGEPDEDFPALDRVRPIASYSEDEFVIVPANDNDFRFNSAKTPTKTISRSVSMTTKHMQVRVFAYPFDHLLSLPIWEKKVDGREKIQQVFDEVCKDRMLESAMFVFRLGNNQQLVPNDSTVSTLTEGQVLELTPKRAIKADGEWSNQGSSSSKSSSQSRLNNSSLPDHPIESTISTGDGMFSAPLLGYHQYKVWRRQQMKLLGRQRRDLAIDGEYIRIQPSDDHKLGDHEKTTSFHIRQVRRVKQSSKVSTNFKILVSKPSGPKIYFLESESSQTTKDIVNHIHHMMRRAGIKAI